MKLAVISQNEIPKSMLESAKKKDIEIKNIDISNLSLIVEKGKVNVLGLEVNDAVIVMVPWKFMLFIEPLLEELSERGVYSQIKPTAFNLLANRAFTYYILKSKNIPMPDIRIYSGKKIPELGVSNLNYPIKAELYKSFIRTQQVIFDSQESLKSYLKGIDSQYDILALMAYERGDIEESLIIGDTVFTIKKSWVESKSTHSQNFTGVKMSEDYNKMVVNAAKNLGMDVGIIITSNSKVIDARISFDIERYETILGTDVSGSLLNFIKKRVIG
jgi:hypothetical protein